MRGLTSADGKMTGNVQTVGSYNKSKGPGGGLIKQEGDTVGGGEHVKSHHVHKHEDGHISSEDSEGNVTHHDNIDEAADHMKTAMDGETANMEDESGDRAEERGGIEDNPKHKTPSFMA